MGIKTKLHVTFMKNLKQKKKGYLSTKCLATSQQPTTIDEFEIYLITEKPYIFIESAVPFLNVGESCMVVAR